MKEGLTKFATGLALTAGAAVSGGAQRNFAPFAEAFQCKPGTAMIRTESERCVVW
jgi:hypothetical protein